MIAGRDGFECCALQAEKYQTKNEKKDDLTGQQTGYRTVGNRADVIIAHP